MPSKNTTKIQTSSHPQGRPSEQASSPPCLTFLPHHPARLCSHSSPGPVGTLDTAPHPMPNALSLHPGESSVAPVMTVCSLASRQGHDVSGPGGLEANTECRQANPEMAEGQAGRPGIQPAAWGSRRKSGGGTCCWGSAQPVGRSGGRLALRTVISISCLLHARHCAKRLHSLTL